jgi:hypothetical protein
VTVRSASEVTQIELSDSTDGDGGSSSDAWIETAVGVKIHREFDPLRLTYGRSVTGGCETIGHTAEPADTIMSVIPWLPAEFYARFEIARGRGRSACLPGLF